MNQSWLGLTENTLKRNLKSTSRTTDVLSYVGDFKGKVGSLLMIFSNPSVFVYVGSGSF